MNTLVIVLALISCITSTQPMQPKPTVDTVETAKPAALPEVEAEFCCACYEAIPTTHSRFSYDTDHLVCIHCYFHKIPKTVNQDFEYICKRRSDGVRIFDDVRSEE